MNLPGPVTYRMDEASHYALWQLMFRKSIRQVLIGIALVLAPLGLFLAWLNQCWIDGLVLAGVGMAAGSACAAFGKLTLRARAKKVYLESASFQEEITFTLTDDGFETDQASGTFRSKWTKMVRWDEDSKIFAVFPNRNTAYVLPKSQFPDVVIAQVRLGMVKSGLPTPWKLRK